MVSLCVALPLFSRISSAFEFVAVGSVGAVGLALPPEQWQRTSENSLGDKIGEENVQRGNKPTPNV